MNFLKLHNKNRTNEISNYNFLVENIVIDQIDYYQSNSITRASKTMAECKNLRVNLKKNGTEG